LSRNPSSSSCWWSILRAYRVKDATRRGDEKPFARSRHRLEPSSCELASRLEAAHTHPTSLRGSTTRAWRALDATGEDCRFIVVIKAGEVRLVSKYLLRLYLVATIHKTIVIRLQEHKIVFDFIDRSKSYEHLDESRTRTIIYEYIINKAHH
jgi:hypothetical protein